MVLLAVISSTSGSPRDNRFYLRVITINTLQMTVVEFTAHSYTIYSLFRESSFRRKYVFLTQSYVFTHEELWPWECVLKISHLARAAPPKRPEGLLAKGPLLPTAVPGDCMFQSRWLAAGQIILRSLLRHVGLSLSTVPFSSVSLLSAFIPNYHNFGFLFFMPALFSSSWKHTGWVLMGQRAICGVNIDV